MTEIRIPDLREPQRDAAEQQIYDMALSMQVDLTPTALLAAATRRTGLEDVGDPSLMERLGAQVAAVDADEGLSGLGRYLIRRRLVGLLAARQRFEDFDSGVDDFRTDAVAGNGCDIVGFHGLSPWG